MKSLALILLLSPIAALAQVVGLHLFSYHTPDPNHEMNNENPGIYVKLDNGLTGGYYINSLGLPSVYAGWTTPEWMRLSATAGLVTGYREDPMLMLVPSARIFTVQGVSARIAYLPRVGNRHMNVLHFMVEKDFK